MTRMSKEFIKCSMVLTMCENEPESIDYQSETVSDKYFAEPFPTAAIHPGLV